jgi:hypothetical protein
MMRRGDVSTGAGGVGGMLGGDGMIANRAGLLARRGDSGGVGGRSTSFLLMESLQEPAMRMESERWDRSDDLAREGAASVRGDDGVMSESHVDATLFATCAVTIFMSSSGGGGGGGVLSGAEQRKEWRRPRPLIGCDVSP